jgi:HAD superfamily hydrolase (TIGR01509 family)
VVGRPIGSFAAVLWDMDGTLVDTEPYWTVAELALADRYGGSWTSEQSLQIVEEMLDDVIAQVGRQVPWRPGARELLASLGEAGVRCGLVTMSWTRLVEPILAHLPAGTFEAVVTGDTVQRGKPHPEPYLTAARRLDVLAGECLAIEDSDTGARSAAGAGCTVLVAPLHVCVPDGPGRIFADTLVGLTSSSTLPA